MPWIANYRASGVELDFSGRCNAVEVLDAHEAVFSHHYDDGFQHMLVDFSPVEYLELPIADLLRITEHHRQYLLRNPPFVLAMIAPQAPVLGLVRTFQRYMEGTSLRAAAVSTREQALVWLRSEMLESV